MKKAMINKLSTLILSLLVILFIFPATTNLMAATLFGKDMDKEYSVNNFDRIIENIRQVKSGKTREVKLFLADDYFVAGWNPKDQRLMAEECDRNRKTDIFRPAECGVFCICLMKHGPAGAGPVKCVSEIEGIGELDNPVSCKYLYLEPEDDFLNINILRIEHKLTVVPVDVEFNRIYGLLGDSMITVDEENNKKPIKDLRPGDKVMTVYERPSPVGDPVSLGMVETEVKQVVEFGPDTLEFYMLRSGEETVSMTGDVKILVASASSGGFYWRDADSLKSKHGVYDDGEQKNFEITKMPKKEKIYKLILKRTDFDIDHNYGMNYIADGMVVKAEEWDYMIDVMKAESMIPSGNMHQ
jgi:hypothetical protein